MAQVQIDIIAVDNFSGVLGNFGNIMTGLKSTIDLLKSAFETLVQPVIDFGWESAMAASRVSELQIVNQRLAEIAGEDVGSLDILAQAIRDQGIEAGVAQESIAKLIEYNLGLGHAVELATIAQNAAVIAGTNSSEMMDRLIYGITTLNTRVLRTGGIMISLNDIYSEYADQMGITIQDIDIHTKQMLALNAVLEFGTKIVGVYDLAMENAFKRFGSYPRYINDIMVALGEQLEPSLRSVVFAGSDMLEWIEKSILQGGIFSGVIKDWATSLDETSFDWGQNIENMMGYIDDLMEKSTNFEVIWKHTSTGTEEEFVQVIDWDRLKENLSEDIATFMQNVANEIDRWVRHGGAEELSEGIANWIENIGSSPVLNSIIIGAGKIVVSLGKALREVDWIGIATAIRDKLVEVLGNLDIKAGALMENLADKINEWTDSGGGDQLATEFVKWLVQLDTSPEVDSAALEGAGAVLDALKKALTGDEGVDWDTIGDAIDYKLAKVIKQVDWTATGEAFAESIGKIFSTIAEGQEGEFDWTRLVPTVYYLKQHWGDGWFVAGREAANEFATGIINGIFGTDFSNLSEVGQDLWDGLRLGFGDLWENFKLIWKFGWDDALAYIKVLLGISSPSTVFFEIGQNIVQGLINGIQSLIGGVLSVLLEPFQPILDFLGIDLGSFSGGFSAPFTGSTAALTGAGTAAPGTATLGTVTNNYNFYGTVYMSGVGPEGTYDCPTPALMTSAQGSLYAPGY